MLFFSLFEHVADAKNWPESDRVLMLQCVLTGTQLYVEKMGQIMKRLKLRY